MMKSLPDPLILLVPLLMKLTMLQNFLRGYSTLKRLLSADLPDDCNDANSIWSILTDKLLYCQSDTSDSVRYFSYDSLKAKSAKQRFFDTALNNEPYSNKAYLDSCNIEYCNDKDL